MREWVYIEPVSPLPPPPPPPPVEGEPYWIYWSGTIPSTVVPWTRTMIFGTLPIAGFATRMKLTVVGSARAYIRVENGASVIADIPTHLAAQLTIATINGIATPLTFDYTQDHDFTAVAACDGRLDFLGSSGRSLYLTFNASTELLDTMDVGLIASLNTNRTVTIPFHSDLNGTVPGGVPCIANCSHDLHHEHPSDPDPCVTWQFQDRINGLNATVAVLFTPYV